MNLTDPECSYGYPVSQLERELNADTFERLNKWMYGQTGAICTGSRYNHETREYEETGHSCGYVIYSGDVRRFLAGSPVID